MTKLAVRRAWFQVHKWIGLVLAVLVIPLSLTGAALVWDEPIDRALHPARYAVSGERAVAVDRYAAAARGVIDRGEAIASLKLPEGDGPVIVQAVTLRPRDDARPGPPQRTIVYLDPPTARLLATSDGGGLLRILHIIHGSLMLPGIGRQIVGWIGVAMMVSAFTGLWLWWPSAGRWTRGLRWRRQPNVDANLHHLFGFWIALPLFVLSLTGAWIALPALFGGGGGGERGGARPQPLRMTRMTPGSAIARAGVAPDLVRQVTWPTDKRPAWVLALHGGRVTVADATGVVARRPPERESVARLMRRIHDGTGMGPVWQTIIFVSGLIPAGLAVTGIIMWWRARRWRGAVTRRQRAPASAV